VWGFAAPFLAHVPRAPGRRGGAYENASAAEPTKKKVPTVRVISFGIT
jgi:hypothetical protein